VEGGVGVTALKCIVQVAGMGSRVCGGRIQACRGWLTPDASGDHEVATQRTGPLGKGRVWVRRVFLAGELLLGTLLSLSGHNYSVSGALYGASFVVLARRGTGTPRLSWKFFVFSAYPGNFLCWIKASARARLGSASSSGWICITCASWKI